LRDFSQCIRDIDAERSHASLQTIIEHIADHQHATSHPLSRTTKIRMFELGQAAITALDGLGEFFDSLRAHAMLAGKLVNLALVDHALFLI
jgi:hypothetical protein